MDIIKKIISWPIFDFAKYLYHKPQHWIIKLGVKLYSKELSINEMDNVVIISPHPDDETFGCGGLIEKLVSLGKNINVVFLTRGEGTADNIKYTVEIVKKHRQELVKSALGVLGLNEDKIHFLNFRDTKIIPDDKNNVLQLQEKIQKLSPDVIFFPHPYEGSGDHENTTRIVESLNVKNSIKLYHYCVWLWHHAPIKRIMSIDFSKGRFVRINRNLKMRASTIYSDAKTDDGFYYSGKLPKLLLNAIYWKKELFFEI